MINMGNDEFILYLRKNYPNCNTENDQLGRRIWEEIQRLDNNATIINSDQQCEWEIEGNSISSTMLPKTATQFSFDRTILISIYNYLNELGG